MASPAVGELGLYRLIECEGSHEIWFTDPAAIAEPSSTPAELSGKLRVPCRDPDHRARLFIDAPA